MRRACLVFLAASAAVVQPACSPVPRFTTANPPGYPSNELSGFASYYAEEFDGRTTANGEKFDMNDLTAAHRTLPFNTIVRVQNLENGKEVVVRVNDRGPFKDGRVIDLSLEAAKQIDLIRSGTAPVKLEILEMPPPAGAK
jgi:rare lipoprotein A